MNEKLRQNRLKSVYFDKISISNVKFYVKSIEWTGRSNKIRNFGMFSSRF